MQKTTEKLHMMGKRFYRRSPSGQCRSDQERRGKPCPGKYQHLHPRHQRRNTAASAGSKRHIDLDRFRLRFGEHTGLPRHSGDRRTAGICRRHHSRELWPRQRTGRCRRSCKSHCRRAAKISRPHLTGGSYPIVSYDPQKRAAADAQTGNRQRLFVLLHVHLGQRSDGQKSCLRSPPVLSDVKTILPPPPRQKELSSPSHGELDDMIEPPPVGIVPHRRHAVITLHHAPDAFQPDAVEAGPALFRPE